MQQTNNAINKDFKPYNAPAKIKTKKPKFNLKQELEGSFIFILLSLLGLAFSINVLYIKKTPMTVNEKIVEVVAKNSESERRAGGYWNPKLTLKDEKGRIFIQTVGFEMYAAKKVGDSFPFRYREYDVTQKNEHLWLYAVVPILIGGISLFMLLTTLWAIVKVYLSVKYFK